jgi:hypothetical protein
MCDIPCRSLLHEAAHGTNSSWCTICKVEHCCGLPTGHVVACPQVIWLRLPKMIRMYRMLRFYRQLQQSTRRPSVISGIVRFIPLILFLTHISACIWWYIGTIRMPIAELKSGDPSVKWEEDHGIHEVPVWVNFYSGLGVYELWPDSVGIWKQYVFSMYWTSSTLSCASLVGTATPKNPVEILFTIWYAPSVCASVPCFVIVQCPHGKLGRASFGCRCRRL